MRTKTRQREWSPACLPVCSCEPVSTYQPLILAFTDNKSVSRWAWCWSQDKAVDANNIWSAKLWMKHPRGPPATCASLSVSSFFFTVNMLLMLGLLFDNNYSPIEGRSFFCLPPPWLSGCIHQQTGNIFIIFIKTIKSNVAQMGLGGGMEAGLEGASACSGAYYHTPLSRSSSLTTPATSPRFMHALVFHPSPNEAPASVSKTDQICFDWGNFPTLFKAVSHFNDIIKGPRQKDE